MSQEDKGMAKSIPAELSREPAGGQGRSGGKGKYGKNVGKAKTKV